MRAISQELFTNLIRNMCSEITVLLLLPKGQWVKIKMLPRWGPFCSGLNMMNMMMMTSSNGIIFRVTGHLCRHFTDQRWIPRTKASDTELWCYLWSAPELNGWVNNREAGDLRRHRAHFDVTVMFYSFESHPFAGSGCWVHTTVAPSGLQETRHADHYSRC